MTNLKPCPFCGKEPAICRTDHCPAYDRLEHRYYIVCMGCEKMKIRSRKSYSRKSSAARAWNTRPPAPDSMTADEELNSYKDSRDSIWPGGPTEEGDDD